MPGKLKASAIGHLGGDPETRFLASGQQVTSFSIGCSVGTKDKPNTEWVRASTWGKVAEIAQQYLSKGTLVEIEGRLTTRSYDAADGSRRFSLEMNVDGLTLLGSKPQREPNGSTDRASDSVDELDSIPFHHPLYFDEPSIW